jgi:hypothetical protein
MYPGNACAHRRSGGCAIYETRPEQPCRTFECAWLQDEEAFPEEMRPDQCGAIVLPGRLWREWRCMKAVPVGAIIPEATLEWLRVHTEVQDTPLIFYEREVIDGEYHSGHQRAYGSPDFAAAVHETIMRSGTIEETVIADEDVIKF